ncbi:MAG TPA: glycosyltransferase family 2 protein [Solirubrobacteraceae bacterium]|nr:glycosyltransferase family 2 protein [Solirubrobacteraceae bacterium]
MTPAQARLTVLLPTYNRAGSLSRTIESVLSQTQQDFELLISDNASEDTTEALCREYVARDSRVRYFRQSSNLGPIGNFNWLLAQPRTEFVLMLADDDWLDADYIARCLAIIEHDPGLSIVTGATRYFEGDAPPDLVLNTNLTEASGSRRVLRYLRHSWSSAAFYGLLRTSAVEDALPIPNVMGADWLFVAALSFAGQVLTTTDTHLNRTRGGTSADFQRIAEVSVLSQRAARNPHLSIAFNQFRDIAFASPVYKPLGRLRRIGLGLAAVGAIVAGHTFDIFWDALGPLILHRRVIFVTGPLRDRWRARHPT